MKSSNVLLTLWCLVIFGVVFAAVFFFVRARQQEDVRPPAPVQVGTKSPGGKGGTPTGKPPQTPPRSGKAPRTPVVQQIRGRVTDAESKALVGVSLTLLPPAKAPPPPPAKDLAEVRRVALIIDIAREGAELPRPVSAWVEAPAVDPSRFEGTPITTATTAEDGSYVLEVPRTVQGPFRVVARSESLGSASRSGVSVGTMDCDLQIATAGVVTGVVSSEASGGPVASCRLVFAAADREWSAVTDGEGAFRIEDMPAGRYSIRAGAAGFVPVLDQEIAVIRSEPVKIRLPRGTTMRVRAVLPGETSQRPEDGSPVADCEVVVLEETSYAYFVGKTNSNGIVEFPGVPAGVWLVNGRGPGVIPVTEERIVVRAADAGADVLLEFEAAVDTPITVVDEEGQPVGGVEFYAGTPDEEFDTLDSEKLPGATDDRGNYKFPFEFMGRRARIYGFKRGYAMLAIAPEDYAAGEPMRVVARKAVKISGVVRTPDGKPIPGAIVTFTIIPPESAADFNSDAIARIVAGPDGRYEFTHAPIGWQTTVEAETLEGQYSDESEDVEPTQDVELNFTIDLETKITAIEMPGAAPQTPGGGR